MDQFGADRDNIQQNKNTSWTTDVCFKLQTAAFQSKPKPYLAIYHFEYPKSSIGNVCNVFFLYASFWLKKKKKNSLNEIEALTYGEEETRHTERMWL